MNMLDKNTLVPLHYQIQQILEENIRVGKFKFGSVFPSERELVLHFGVSRGTIRKVLFSMVHDGLIVRRPGQGTFVAASEKKNTAELKFETIGVVMYAPSMESHGFMFRLWNAINDVAQRDDHHVLLLPFTNNNVAASSGYLLDSVQKRGIKGVIVTAEEVPDEEIMLLHKNNIPTVLLERYSPDKEIPSIRIDYQNKILRAVRHLKSLGHKRIAYIGNERKYRVVRECIKYFCASVKFIGLEYEDRLIKMGGRVGARTFQATSELLAMKEPPTAVIVQDPFHYIGVLNACRQRGLEIPEQLSVISLTEFHIGSILEPALTSYDIDALKMVHIAFETLDKMMRGQPVRSQNFKSKLIKRDSCSYAKRGTKVELQVGVS
jgi:DNA-binding LacI/PurR family transcriptional regulator